MTAPETERPPVARTTEGQPSTVEANGITPFAHHRAAGKPEGATLHPQRRKRRSPAATAFRSAAGGVWRYAGKRGRVLAMFATMPDGLRQWDSLPWHTRLGGTIHVLRRDGLAIDTQREGDFRHARYRLTTPGALIIQRKNTGESA